MKIILPLFLLAWATASSAQMSSREAANSLSVRVEAAGPAFERGDQVLLRVSIENTQPGCRPRFFDRVIVGDPSPRRPLSILTLEIRDARGHLMTRAKHPEANWAMMDARSLIRLDCWESFGRVVMPESAEWGYQLAPGRYRAKATLILKSRPFFSDHPKLLKEAAEWTGLPQERLLEALTDQTVSSDETAFEVRN